MTNWIKKIFTVRTYPRKIAWFWGGDVLRLRMYPPLDKPTLLRTFNFKFRLYRYRTIWKFAWRFYNEIWVNNIECKRGLIEHGIPEDRIEIKEVPPDMIKYEKVKHSHFTVLLYLPHNRHRDYGGFTYGEKYIKFILEQFPNVIVVDGTRYMSEIYPCVDCFVKFSVTKYNGINRMGKECMFNEIPVLHLRTYLQSNELNRGEILQWINTKKDTWLTNQEKKVNS